VLRCSKFKTELDNISTQLKSDTSVAKIGKNLTNMKKENDKFKSELVEVQMSALSTLVHHSR